MLLRWFLPPDPEDYVGSSFPLIFTSETGQNTSVCVPAGNIAIVNDTIVEEDETFSVQLTTIDTQIILSPQTGTATIIDDDGNSFLLLIVCTNLQTFILFDQCDDRTVVAKVAPCIWSICMHQYYQSNLKHNYCWYPSRQSILSLTIALFGYQ